MMKYSPFHDDEPSNNDPTGVQTTSDQAAGQPSAPRHPIALFFHFFFKGIAIGIYILDYFISFGFVITFIVITLSSAFDFWTVKNVSGRLLAGLRWWNEIQPDGSDKWHYESTNNKASVNQSESFLFWVGLIGCPLVWAVFTVFSIFSLLKFSFGWLVVDIICLALSGYNVYSYIKCAKDARKKVKGMAQSYLCVYTSVLPQLSLISIADLPHHHINDTTLQSSTAFAYYRYIDSRLRFQGSDLVRFIYSTAYNSNNHLLI
ncbi:hypothetical protein DFA_00433 [Cavenderia fasciculata]|uniref:Golgi apparatus membrane protein TVP23 homolog n=1 Tax=Cavenderia fasciculata TaxID=261658 RepID=F4PRS3_CACFS|nr:uncharacterized protein DFA_00433 [Cavenderia fasciculata]EGG20572.1 hypothetical protein DFA_00433 [Cavenderia fasciculata]|eukprot:XP_004358422.1 hypothetical protein DFA_00433 [Cavenderia fasciculata]